ncbi:PadR family transcriptional regulator [Microbacterium ulmi]|uniref:PadR family transcriptional regulator n=1 Tax=Microbacterium ulmi TaxID=179095 RepID=A0A7Y2PZP2_9MICO|nr:PadR family transcriptional regulator [Microbacterium ulmi]NII69609.1 DNA-binding PadR family transcriptional regulator [Microbacterium ulmi]NNH03503.1 PadR family transcriptional regulator [Microbacterium ulmi]
MSDAAASLTPLGVIVLGLLAEMDLHPYEMMRLIRQRGEDQVVKVTNGTFYHTVSRLERDGLIAEVGVDRAGNRPERTTYALTPAGRAAAQEWVRRELPRFDRPEPFRVALAEAHTLARAEVVELLSQRRVALAASVDEHRERLANVVGRGVPLQFLVELDRRTAILGADLTWLDGLLTRLADTTLAWGVDELPDEVLSRLAAYRKAHLS